MNPFALTETKGIRRFSDSKLSEAIDSALKRKKDKKDLVVVGHVDKEVMYFSALYKIGDDFSIVAAAYKSKDAPGIGYGAEVIWTPF